MIDQAAESPPPKPAGASKNGGSRTGQHVAGDLLDLRRRRQLLLVMLPPRISAMMEQAISLAACRMPAIAWAARRATPSGRRSAGPRCRGCKPSQPSPHLFKSGLDLGAFAIPQGLMSVLIGPPFRHRHARRDRAGRKPGAGFHRTGRRVFRHRLCSRSEVRPASGRSPSPHQLADPPRWPEFGRVLPRPRLWRLAFSMPILIASSPMTWPSPNCPLDHDGRIVLEDKYLSLWFALHLSGTVGSRCKWQRE